MRNLFAAIILLLTVGCTLLQPTPDLAWDHDPEALIIQAKSGGGLQPEAAYYNEIPRAQVWGDGRIIWQSRNEGGGRQVWQGQLSEMETADLLQTFADKGFFQLKDHYEPSAQVYDSSSTSLRVNLLAESKSVGEYHEGAPRRFHELVGLVSSGAGAEGQPYVPQAGYLTAALVTPWDGLDTTAVPQWDTAVLGLDLEEAAGVWVEGEALARAWEIVNQKYWSPMVVQGDAYYELYLQLPELTGREVR
ncbi:MAG: hypothetical protein GY796_16005 [Chloroflexi bacterium]|nr:hypothetical protein [Chloroflexota bacterium]